MARYVIPYFEGVNESAGELAGNAAAARLARNVTTDYGRLASAAGASPYIEAPAPGGAQSLYVVCETDADGERTEYVVAGTDSAVCVFREGQWKTLYTGTAGDWGFLSYKKEDDSILIFGNGVDPVQCWDGASETSAALAGAPAKGKYFALHYERVWMCGDAENPDRLYYSRMLDPNDWTGDVVTPEMGGGFVDLPTFDGGVITNLYSVGGDLCILKSTTALLLYGTSPENYQVTRMSGEPGTIAGRTAAVYGQTGYFVTAHGIGVQSGTTIVLLDDRKLPRLFDATFCEEENCAEGLSPHFGGCAAGICFRERLYFALPLGQETANSIVLEYDLARETYVLHDEIAVRGFARSGLMRERLLALGADGKVYALGTENTAGAQWTTPWIDFGTSEEKVLRAFALYGRLESPGRRPCVRVTVESERGKKVRYLEALGPREKLYKRRFRLGGRRFRVDISAVSGTRFCFTGGLELETE